jgi:hypothetical protein
VPFVFCANAKSTAPRFRSRTGVSSPAGFVWITDWMIWSL